MPHSLTETTPSGASSAPADGQVMIRARDLRKTFGDFEAVKGIDVEVHRGEVFGFLGPNGAGKSSTMRMISAISPVTSGELTVLGMDPWADASRVKARLGVCPQEDLLDIELTVRDNLYVYGRYFGLPRKVVRERVEELLAFAKLTDKADNLVDELSGGMKRRLTIARSLINRPDLLLLDEPTTGLDPQARHLLWDQLYRLKEQGVTLVLTTHYMDEAEQLCDRLVVMDEGRIVAEGTPSSLIADHATPEVAELRFGIDQQEQHADGVRDAVQAADLAQVRVEVLPDRLLVYTSDGDRALQAVADAGLEPRSTLVRRATLEDVFLTLTGRTLVD